MLGEIHGRIREYVSVSRSTTGESCVELCGHEKRVVASLQSCVINC